MTVAVFKALGLSPQMALPYVRASRMNGTSIHEEMQGDPTIDQPVFYQAISDAAGIGFLANPHPDRLIPFASPLRDLLALPPNRMICLYSDGKGGTDILISPDIAQVSRFSAYLRRYPVMQSRMKVVPPEAFRKALFKATGADMIARSANRLFVTRPQLSARIVTNSWQSALFGSLAVLIPVCLLLWPQSVLVALHLLSTLVFFSCMILRVLPIPSAGKAAASWKRSPAPGPLPVYTVLIALYREENMVPDLLVSLSRLRWPRSRLEVKLVCEADDEATINAIRSHALGGTVEIVEVPAGGPRTKPNALAYALQASRGEFVVLYDAEDKPHPDQLLEAWSVFRKRPPALACLQAPLVITNGHVNRMAGMFALEYAGLFRGLLPWLARNGLILPLGGTSNHFRREALDEVLGWDPYNVTEDADLGIRLSRAGHRCGTLTSPTLEEAPEDFRTWLGQRSRWFKGWMQCWLVHNRGMKVLGDEIKIKNFFVSQIFLAGITLSVLIYPASIFVIIYDICNYITGKEFIIQRKILLFLDFSSLIISHAGFYVLGRRSQTDLEKKNSKAGLFFLPAYWLMMSWAGWRAVIDLLRRPHHWEKTPHKPMATLQPQRSPLRK